MKKMLLILPPNRVRRNYKGGQQLDRLEGKTNPSDSNRPEDWIASTTKAHNPGLAEIANEGLAFVKDQDGQEIILKELFEKYPEHYLGEKHFKKMGSQLGFLAKLLDSSMRLHVQAHPTARFAQEHLNSRWGKLETYVILGVRENCDGYIRLGFQHLSNNQEWKRIVFEQDIAAMNACFEKVPVEPGQVWVVPGGLPHAIGEGLVVLEVMEPTDLVVRCEFEREGIVVPPEARFMGRDPGFAMEIFDHTTLSVEEITKKCKVKPVLLDQTSNFSIELLIGPGQTDCFEVFRFKFSNQSTIKKDDKLQICIISEGSGTVEIGTEKIAIKEGSRFLIASAASEATFMPNENQIITALVCGPGIIN